MSTIFNTPFETIFVEMILIDNKKLIEKERVTDKNYKPYTDAFEIKSGKYFFRLIENDQEISRLPQQVTLSYLERNELEYCFKIKKDDNGCFDLYASLLREFSETQSMKKLKVMTPFRVYIRLKFGGVEFKSKNPVLILTNYSLKKNPIDRTTLNLHISQERDHLRYIENPHQ